MKKEGPPKTVNENGGKLKGESEPKVTSSGDHSQLALELLSYVVIAMG